MCFRALFWLLFSEYFHRAEEVLHFLVFDEGEIVGVLGADLGKMGYRFDCS